eukprot:366116-Chlamydomonas_euryale.AAC.4
MHKTDARRVRVSACGVVLAGCALSACGVVLAGCAYRRCAYRRVVWGEQGARIGVWCGVSREAMGTSGRESWRHVMGS